MHNTKTYIFSIFLIIDVCCKLLVQIPLTLEFFFLLMSLFCMGSHFGYIVHDYDFGLIDWLSDVWRIRKLVECTKWISRGSARIINFPIKYSFCKLNTRTKNYHETRMKFIAFFWCINNLCSLSCDIGVVKVRVFWSKKHF